MTTPEQYQYRISLLDEYARSLQRENNAKNEQTRVIYQQLGNLTAENQMFKALLDQMKRQMEQRQIGKSLVNCSLRTSVNFFQEENKAVEMSVQLMDVQCQVDLEEQEQIKHISEIMSLNNKLRQKDQSIRQKQGKIYQYEVDLREINEKMEQYLVQNQEMYEAIEKLQQERDYFHDQNRVNEEKIRNLMETNLDLDVKSQELRAQLQELNYKMYNTTEQSQNQKQIHSYQSSHLRSELDRMVKQNNELIERIRQLQKQKNAYYSELKRATHISFGSNQNSVLASNVKVGSLKGSENKRKQIKGERWSMIEQKIKSIRSQNEQIQANLAIK